MVSRHIPIERNRWTEPTLVALFAAVELSSALKLGGSAGSLARG